MQTLKLKLFTAVAAGVLAASVAHANLVVNGGFETGDFTGWTLVGNPGFRGVDGGPDAHSGSFGAYFGAEGSLGGILQAVVPTVASESYIFDFWLQSYGGTPSEARVSWDGGVVLSLINPAAFGYTHYTYTVTATGASTPVKFEFRNDPDFFSLDDISVVAVPEPSTYLAGALLVLPFGVQGVRYLRNRKQVA